MDHIVEELIDFYANYKELAIAIVSSLTTLAATLIIVFFKQIVGLIRKVIVALGKVIGGEFGYKSYLDNYLNWVVVEYQDLNLTGIIGGGVKPKLEQVFISLNISPESTPLTEQRPSAASRTWRQIRFSSLQGLIKSETAAASQKINFFSPSRSYFVRCFIERHHQISSVALITLLLSILVGLIFALPAYLMLSSSTTPFQNQVAGFIVGVTVMLFSEGIVDGFRDRDRITIALSSILLGINILFSAIMIDRTTNVSTSNFGIGIGLGAGAYLLFSLLLPRVTSGSVGMQNAISEPSSVWLELGDEHRLLSHLKHAACFDYAHDGQLVHHPTQMAWDHHSTHAQPLLASQ